jgi:catechol 2,3-dioxygenase-like lactoylglutathione lyase family enzyme
METLIAKLVHQFERGALSRRQLIQGLSSLALAASASPAAAQTTPQSAALKGTRIDHVSILVNDMARSTAFYQSVFGLAPVSEDKEHKILRLGGPRTIVSLRQEPPAGTVDHFAIAVEGFNRAAVTEALKPRGLTPQENIEYGFYINDPDGVHVQIV